MVSDFLPLSHVTFSGYITCAGYADKNLSARQARCELHLHQESGMVRVVRGGEETWVGASQVVSCDVDRELGAIEANDPAPVSAPTPAPEPSPLPAPAPMTAPELAHTPRTSRADEILAEMGHVSGGAPNLHANNNSPKSRGIRRKGSN